MMTPTPANDSEKRPLRFSRAAHIFTLCGFAVTQPLLTALNSQSVFLRDQQVGWLEIGTLLTILMLILPLTFVALDQIAIKFSKRINGHGQNIVFFVLFTVVMLSFLRPYVAASWLMKRGLATIVDFSIAIPGAGILVFLYQKVGWARAWLTFTSIGIVIFPGLFLWQFHSIRKDDPALNEHTTAKNPVPVIIVVFDEFSGITLMNEKMEIDSPRFPQFARLAKHSTWYRNATTVHSRTGFAVPAILSGRYPTTDRPAVAAEYPGNLFQVIESTKQFDMAVFEPATRVAPRSLTRMPEPERTYAEKSFNLIRILAAVYPRLIIANDTPFEFPPIPRAWFGIHENTLSRSGKFREMTEGLFAYQIGIERDQQLDHFLKCIQQSDRPRFCFLHAMLPHYPWCFLPTGEKYQSEFLFTQSPTVGLGEIGEDWPTDASMVVRNEHRYRLQVGYVDRFIGQLLDRLIELGILDQCLLIVTSDHGVAFQPGHSRRVPDSSNLAEIMSTPLFIKLPEQTEGSIDDRNIESIDLLPTIADVLKMNLTEPCDGIPVSREARRSRKTLYFEKSMTIVEPAFPQRTSAINRKCTVFGENSLEQLPASASSHPDWHGQGVDQFLIDPRSVPFQSIDPFSAEKQYQNDVKSPVNRRLVSGQLFTKELVNNSADLVVAIDGVICDTGKFEWYSPEQKTFQFLLPESAFVGSTGNIEFYLVDLSQKEIRLRPLSDGSRVRKDSKNE